MNEIVITQRFAASPERVFAALADQDAMGRWMGSKISVPVRGPDGLVGTVRRVHVGPYALDERIVDVEPPKRIAYQVVSRPPMLKRHHGELRIEPEGTHGATVIWTVHADFKPAFVGNLVLPLIQATLARGLSRLAKELRSF